MPVSNIGDKSSNPLFLSQVELVQSLLNARLKSYQGSPRSFGIFSDAAVRIFYCYATYISNEIGMLEDVTLSNVLKRSDEYYPAIRGYFGETLDDGFFKELKDLLSKISDLNNVLRYIIEEECSSIDWGTPESITSLALEILAIKEGETVADVGSGAGNYLLKAAAENPNAKFTGFEINTELYLVSQMRKYLHNGHSNTGNVDIIQKDAFDLIDSDSHVRFDKVFSNYPVNMPFKFSGIGQRYLDRISKTDPRVNSLGSGDWVFNKLIRDLTTRHPNGKAVGIMAGGGTWNSTDKYTRKSFLDLGIVECVIALPAKLFRDINFPLMIIVFSFGNLKVRMIDATQLLNLGRRQNYMTPEHVMKIVKALKEDSEYSRAVEYEEIESQDYVLDPRRYLQGKIEFENGVPFGSVIKSIRRGAQKTAKELDLLMTSKTTDIQYLMLSNIHEGLIDDNLNSLIELDESLEKYCLKDNDLILSKNGYPYKVAIAHPRANQKILANGNLYIIELDQEKINPLYLKAFLENETGINSLKSISVGVAIPNLPVESLKKMQIPLPPMTEQNLIAERYLALLDEIKVLRIKLDKAIKRLGEVF